MTTSLGPGLTYSAGVTSELRPVRRADGQHVILTAHRAAAVSEHLLAAQLEWLAQMIDTCGDGICAGLIDDLGRPWTLTRGVTRMAGRLVWCAQVVSATGCMCCPVEQPGADWLREVLGQGAVSGPIYDQLPF